MTGGSAGVTEAGNTGRKKRRGLRPFDWFLILAFLIGFGIYSYPRFSDLWNRMRDERLRTKYGETVREMTDDEVALAWETARAYQAQHTVNTIVDAFSDEEYVLTHPYDTILNINGDGIMGSLSIPKIGLELSIYHGIGAEGLEKGCGHVEGTSLPIGGESTHSVLAAHRGLPSARLFTDLDQLEEGDLFYITVLDETLAYQVDQISVVLPSESDALAIVEGEDYVTLLTCTPYGVNSHRLLVRGSRTEYREEEKESLEQEIRQERTDTLRAMVAGGAAFALGLAILLIIIKRKERKQG